MSLHARLGARSGRFRLDAGLELHPGETVALVGPSGAGKTTALRLLAGVAGLDAGRIVLDDEVLDAPDDKVFVVPHRRRVGWAPQGGALLAHLSAAENVAFPLRVRGARPAAARASAVGWLDRLGLGGRADARPADLSGGEVRRVAIARALAAEPRVLLFDEPFSGLDAAARVSVRRAIREAWEASDALRLLVAHEPVDALSLADRVVVLEGGSVVQVGTPAELCARPRTPYVAELVGLNLMRGRAGVEGGHPVVRGDDGVLQVAEIGTGGAGPGAGADVVATFRPSAVGVFRDPPSGSPRNVIEGTVAEMIPTGERVRVRIDARPSVVAELTADAARALDLRPGERAYAVVKATEIEVTPAP